MDHTLWYVIMSTCSVSVYQIIETTRCKTFRCITSIVQMELKIFCVRLQTYADTHLFAAIPHSTLWEGVYASKTDWYLTLLLESMDCREKGSQQTLFKAYLLIIFQSDIFFTLWLNTISHISGGNSMHEAQKQNTDFQGAPVVDEMKCILLC